MTSAWTGGDINIIANVPNPAAIAGLCDQFDDQNVAWVKKHAG